MSTPSTPTSPAPHHYPISLASTVSRWTLTRRFRTFWLIDIPNQPDPDRIYDQIFIDGTYTQAGCLLVAASLDHVSPGTGHPPNQHRPTHNY